MQVPLVSVFPVCTCVCVFTVPRYNRVRMVLQASLWLEVGTNHSYQILEHSSLPQSTREDQLMGCSGEGYLVFTMDHVVSSVHHVVSSVHHVVSNVHHVVSSVHHGSCSQLCSSCSQ